MKRGSVCAMLFLAAVLIMGLISAWQALRVYLQI